MIDRNSLNEPPFCACWLWVGADHGTVDHMPPVVTQPQIHQGLQQRVPHALFSPTAKPDIDRILLAITLMHVTPRTTDAQNIQHTVEKTAIVSGLTGPTSALRRQEQTNHRPFPIR